MQFTQLYQHMLTLLGYLKGLGVLILEFLFTNFLGSPLIYWMLGAGLIVYLGVKIATAIILPND